MTTIEKVAKALARKHAEQRAVLYLSTFENDHWQQFKPSAVVALLALKDPDEGTVEAVMSDNDWFSPREVAEMFNAALDHIIKGGSE
jgi:hypothetical protein